MQITPEPFFFPGGDTACLLIHGFSNSPWEMRPLGSFLTGRGLTVAGVRLAGHGTSIEDMSETTWQQWAASAEEAWQSLRQRCRTVVVAGQSGGGLIALYLAQQHPVTGLVVMSAPIYLPQPWPTLVPFLRNVLPWYRPTGNDLTDRAARQAYYVSPAAYERKPLSAIEELVHLQAAVRGRLSQVTAPLLLIYGRRDSTIETDNAELILAGAGSPWKRLLWMENSGHGLVVDSEKEQVWSAIYDFVSDIERQSQARSTADD